MATTPTPAPPKGGGNVLTRKLGPFPGWVWAAIAVGGFYLWKKHEASTTAAAATTAASTTAAAGPGQGTVQSSYPQAGSGYYSGPGVGNGGSGAVPTGATAATNAPPTNQVLSGSGYDVGGASGSTSNSVTSIGGGTYQQIGANQLQALESAGQTLYYQSQPGVFSIASGNAGLSPGTAIFQQTAGAAGA